MSYIKYGDKELNHLKSVDEKMKEAILEIGMLKRYTNSNLYLSLIESIIGQQISTKAANTIRNNLKTLVKEITPTNILKYSDEDLRSCGLSFRKISYIKDISKAFNDGLFSYEELDKLSDEEIIKTLTKLKGVGPWTVEMLLIHTFKRPDVVTYLDLALKNGLRILHGLDEIDLNYFNKYKKLYSPYGTVASIYLWEIYRRHNNK